MPRLDLICSRITITSWLIVVGSLLVIYVVHERPPRAELPAPSPPLASVLPTSSHANIAPDTDIISEKSPTSHPTSETYTRYARSAPKQRSRPTSLFQTNPQLAKLQLQYDLRRRLAPLYNRLGLTIDQISALEDTLTSVESHSLLKLTSAESFYRENPNHSTALALENTQKALRERVVGVLGAQVGDEVLITLKTEALQTVIHSLAVDSFSARETFTPQQSRSLFEILHRSSANGNSKPLVDSTDINWAQVLHEAKALLTDRQFSVLEGLAAKGHFDAHFYRVTGTETPPFSMIW